MPHWCEMLSHAENILKKLKPPYCVNTDGTGDYGRCHQDPGLINQTQNTAHPRDFGASNFSEAQARRCKPLKNKGQGTAAARIGRALVLDAPVIQDRKRCIKQAFRPLTGQELQAPRLPGITTQFFAVPYHHKRLHQVRQHGYSRNDTMYLNTYPSLPQFCNPH